MPKLRPAPTKPAPEDLDVHISLPPEGDIEIELSAEDAGPVDVDVSPQPTPAPKTDDDNPLQRALDAQKRAEELQAAAQRERDEALRHARERDEELSRERGERQDAEFNSVLTAIAAEQSLLDKAESDYAAFAAAQDWANAAKAQKVMATAASRLDRLEDSKQAFEGKRGEKPTTTDTRTAAPPPRAPDFEQRIAQMPEQAKVWLRKHPEFIQEDSLNRKIGGVHQYLTEHKGVQAFSPAYFDALDTEFGFKTADTSTTTQPTKRSIPMTAPVSRDAVSPSGTRQGNKITLTEEERRIARDSIIDRPDLPKLTDAQKEYIYAQNKQRLLRMRATGEYRQTTEQTG